MTLNIRYYKFAADSNSPTLELIDAGGISSIVPEAIQDAMETALASCMGLGVPGFNGQRLPIRQRYKYKLQIAHIMRSCLQHSYAVHEEGLEQIYYVHGDDDNDTGGDGWDPERTGVQMPVSTSNSPYEPTFFASIEQ